MTWDGIRPVPEQTADLVDARAPTARAKQHYGHVAEAAQRRISQLQREMEEQQELLTTARAQTLALEDMEAGIVEDAQPLLQAFERLGSTAMSSDGTVDMRAVFGSKLDTRGRQVWGKAWDEGVNGRPPVREVFQLSPSDVVDVRNYLRQAIRNGEQGISMPQNTDEAVHQPTYAIGSSMGGHAATVPQLPLHRLRGKPPTAAAAGAQVWSGSDSGELFDDV